MKSTFNLMRGVPLLPIVQPKNVVQGLKTVEAIANSGLRNIEVVRRTAAAFEALSAMRKHFPELNIGMGTLMNSSHIHEALDAGAQFLVTPTATPKLLTSLVASNAPFLPGVAGPSDILTAYEFGVREMKLFPAHLSGGPDFIKAIGSVFNDVTFCPTGGVNLNNADSYLALDNVKAVGGTWMIPARDVNDGNWLSITQRCKDSVALFSEVAA